MPVDFASWIRESASEIRDDPLRGALTASYAAYLGLWHTVTTRLEPGMNVFERDWDLLVVLDACRVDALRSVANEYPFLSEVGSVQSVGSSSHEWMAHTFTTDYAAEIRETAYTNPNGFSELCFVDGDYPPRRTVPVGSFRWDPVKADDFGLLDINWQRGHDPELGIVPPRYMTDRAVSIGRETDFERYVVHYYQPHKPYVAGAVREDRPPNDLETDPWAHLRRGEATREDVWECYLENLRLVLNEVELLLENLDAETVVITADHGDAMGELRAYGHPEGFPHPVTRRVPWVKTTAVDERTYHPSGVDDISVPGDDTEDDSGDADAALIDRLADLGYV